MKKSYHFEVKSTDQEASTVYLR